MKPGYGPRWDRWWSAARPLRSAATAPSPRASGQPSAASCPKLSRDGRKLHVNDSKRVYTPAEGLAQLELIHPRPRRRLPRLDRPMRPVRRHRRRRPARPPRRIPLVSPAARFASPIAAGGDRRPPHGQRPQKRNAVRCCLMRPPRGPRRPRGPVQRPDGPLAQQSQHALRHHRRPPRPPSAPTTDRPASPSGATARADASATAISCV